MDSPLTIQKTGNQTRNQKRHKIVLPFFRSFADHPCRMSTKYLSSPTKPQDDQQYNAPQSTAVKFRRFQRRASTGGSYSSASVEKMGIEADRPKRRSSITFAVNDDVVEVPRVEESQKKDLFYQDNEMWTMRCEAKMRAAGMDPDNFDWRSMR
jgi:hypothetical protein